MGILGMVPNLLYEIGNVIGTIVEFFWNLPGRIFDIGANIIKGLWNGISDMAGWLLSMVKGFGESVIGGIKKVFGIHSPSTVFRDQIGKNLALGLGEGFIGTMRSVSDDMIKAVPTEYEIDPVKQPTTELTGGKLVGAITDALKGVKVVMNDREMGSFVINTVGKVVYS